MKTKRRHYRITLVFFNLDLISHVLVSEASFTRKLGFRSLKPLENVHVEDVFRVYVSTETQFSSCDVTLCVDVSLLFDVGVQRFLFSS